MDSSLPNCLLTLKALKRKYINYEESNEPTPFCSYYIKTACFWIYETFPHKECSIMNLIRELLNWLIDCYQHGNLPHYFIPSQNLIGYLSEKVRYEVQEKLKAVNSKKKIWSMVMSCVVLDYEVINVVCDKLGIAKVCEGDDFQQLETDLLHHPNAKARVALKEGDMEKASSNLKDMKECTPIIAGELKKNAMSLIRLIENEINPPNRYL
ncbi:uncharacterized protein LOC117114049 isoform X2 [Anneissia japonica]|uniref:uncharacterized protein LOC117114049 isoform X2 n=1 Tax=Anneissia japonica TaxID=1529436 RepID=UPI001425715C|nr:uncharacterized protein LOC117114049 isoform X2 [Anneissia japonica]